MDEPVSNLMTVADAIALIDALPVTPRRIAVPLSAAAGFVLADDLSADRDFPPFDKSLMDGYAIRGADSANVLEVIGEIAAGQMQAAAIGPNQAVAVMTGAPIPPGADAVVPIEDTDSPDAFVEIGNKLRVRKQCRTGNCIARRGSDCKQGSTVLAAGAKLSAPQIAVAASIGASKLQVWDRPRCAVFATGGEIVAVNQTPQPAQIRNSNNPMLSALLARFCGTVRDLGVVPDDRAAISQRIRDCLHDDVLFITGGMSMGKYDYVPSILRELGGELKITKLAIKPGKPFVLAAMPDGKYVVGLPGNPVSAFVCTLRLASRLLIRIAGGKPSNQTRQILLAVPIPANGPREFYQPAIINDGKVRPLNWKGSADIFTLAKADALIVRPPNAPPLEADQNVMVIDIE
jgi:molybdopterin molybdotransferase